MAAKGKKKGKKAELDEKRNDNIKEKSYITKEIETSITLLESPENNIVLEALLFLSKYADIQTNNLNFVQSHGLLPKLLALLDHNICILRVSLRLLSNLLAANAAAQNELNQEKFDGNILKICRLYMEHGDNNVKEFSGLILATFSKLGRVDVLLQEPNLLKCILTTIKSPENDIILNSSLELFGKLIEIQSVRIALPEQTNFDLETFLLQMNKSDDCFRTILNIFEKMTYFGEDPLQIRLKECRLVEHIFHIIIDPDKIQHQLKCLKIVMHSMGNENTNSYFVQSIEFLKFRNWVKTCPDSAMSISINILLELAKIDSIKQMLFDLAVEDAILSFLRSDDKKTLNMTCEAISHMSRHKYCCEKMVTPIVIKKILQMLQRVHDVEDPQNETALTTLHYLCRRDSRTIHMIHAYNGLDVILKYLKAGTGKVSEQCYRRLLEIVNMFITDNQLKKYMHLPEVYDAVLVQTSQDDYDEIAMKSLEILINCLDFDDFQRHFLSNKGTQRFVDKLANCGNEKMIRILTVFLHNSMMYEEMANDFIHHKLLLILKQMPYSIKHRNPLIKRITNLIYNRFLPIKFFETGRLELVDKLTERFYIINGSWIEPFPFLEVLELRQMSTRCTIYVVDACAAKGGTAEMRKESYKIHQQNKSKPSMTSITSLSSLSMKCAINYGRLSHDPYLVKYTAKVHKLLTGVGEIKDKIAILARFVDGNLCGPKEDCTVPDKLHSFKLHIECIKEKLGTNMIPIGYLRLGFHCERALLFKALADRVYIPATLVKGKSKLYWNEIALIHAEDRRTVLKMYVVDLMNNIGQLLLIGSKECNAYCDVQ